MKTARRWAVAAAVVLIAAMLTGILLPQRFNPQQAFAQMVANVQQVRTAVMSVVITMTGQTPITAKMYMDNSGKIRQEIDQHNGMKMINICDVDAGKMIALMPSQKQAVVIDLGQLPPEQMPRNVVDQFRKLPPEAAQWKEKITENGRTLLVYEVEKQPGMKTTLWVDETTLLPVRSQMNWLSPIGPMLIVARDNVAGQTEVKDIQWDVPLAADMFSLTPPSEYTVRPMDFNLANAGPQDVVAMLRLWAYFNDGAFPDKLEANSLFDFQKLIGQRMKQQGGDEHKVFAEIASEGLGMDVKEIDEEQAKQIVQKLTVVPLRGLLYLGPLFKNKTFTWTGQGAKLGDENRIVCYWPDADGKTYQGIDAKLNLVTLTAEQLPKAAER